MQDLRPYAEMIGPLFTRLDTKGLVREITAAERSVCYAAPGILDEPAAALARLAAAIGPELIDVCLDLDERVIRMGYGTLEAVKLLQNAGITVRSTTGLRAGILVVDDSGYIFTPTALYLESDTSGSAAPNAMRLNSEQAQEALARISPAAKMMAVAFAKTAEEKDRILQHAVEVASEPVESAQIETIENNLAKAPPISFDVARQVRVYTAYLQYVDLKLTGAAIQRKRIALPRSLQQLGRSKTLEGRLKTTFDLVERGGELSSSELENELHEIRRNYTRPLGREHGRVILNAVKPAFEERISELRQRIAAHQHEVEARLQAELDRSQNEVLEYFLPLVTDRPPDVMKGQVSTCNEDSARRWLAAELDRVFPKAAELLQKIELDLHYKDVTFETLNSDSFLERLRAAYPFEDWDKAHHEFKAAGAAGS